MKIGEALRLIRVLNGLTQKELAREIDLSDSYVSEVERGNREPSLTVIKKYSEYFRVPVSSIMLFAESVSESEGGVRGLMSERLLEVMKMAAGERDKKK